MDDAATVCFRCGSASSAEQIVKVLPCNKHGECVGKHRIVGVGAKAGCRACHCAVCDKAVATPEYVFLPCRCALHQKCRPKFIKYSRCEACKQACTGIAAATPPEPDNANVVNPTPSECPGSAKSHARGTSFSLTGFIKAATGRDAQTIMTIAANGSGVQSLIDNKYTLDHVLGAGIDPLVLKNWGATRELLKRFGMTKKHLASGAMFKPALLAACGVDYDTLKTDYNFTWADMRNMTPPVTIETLVILGATMTSLVRDGFNYADLERFKKAPFSVLANDLQLRKNAMLLIMAPPSGFGLNPELLARLRADNPNNWTYAQLQTVLPSESLRSIGAVGQGTFVEQVKRTF